MSITDLKGRHLFLIGLYSSRYAIRGGTGLLFFLLAMAAGLLVAYGAMMPLEQLEYEMRLRHRPAAELPAVFEARMEDAVPFVSAVLGERPWGRPPPDDRGVQDAWARWLLLEKPAMLSEVFLILLYAIPFLAVLAGFNQYAGDVATKGVRFQLLRTERANLYFGRFLGTAAYASVTILLLLATIVVFLGARVDFYSFGALALWAVRGTLALLVLLLPYLAFAGLISAAIDSPFGALVLSALPVAGVPLAALLAGLQWPWAKHLAWALPWGCQLSLLHHDPGRVLLAVLACLGYTALFLGCGYWNFSRRDL